MILDAAGKFLDIKDITGEDLDFTLREGFEASQTAAGASIGYGKLW